MKSLLLALFLLSCAASLKAQSQFPDCTDLLVDSVYLSGTDLRVVLSNTCSTCASGINGAIYLEMVVTKRSNPADTIASTKCWCYSSPDNNSQLGYSIPTVTTSLPALSEIRVALDNLCADIPYRYPTSIAEPVSDGTDVLLESTGRRLVIIRHSGQQYRLYDNLGRTILKGTIHEDRLQVEFDDVAPGIYYLELTNNQNRDIRKFFLN